MARADRRPSGLRASLAGTLLSAGLLSAFAVGSCAARPRTFRLEADGALMPVLESILRSSPPPERWIAAREGAAADAAISLGYADRALPSKAARAPAGSLYSAPSLPLADPRFSLPRAEASASGLVPLEAIEPPRRAVPVDGRWPGEEGYPFVRELTLSAIDGDGGAPPRDLASWLVGAAAAARAARSAPATLCATGDIQAVPREGLILAAGGARLGELFRGDLLPRMRRADILVGNLEGDVSGGGAPNPRKRFLFRMPPGTARALQGAGFDLVLFANNHTFDYGAEAFLDTLGELEESGLAFAGAGRDAAAAASPRRVDVAGKGSLTFVGFASFPRERLGFTTEEAAAGASRPGVNADEAATVAAISAAAASGETVVVLAHGGAEYVGTPPPYLRARYRRFARAGAALVIGSHPHVLQGAEAEGTSLIAYSLGNFLFTGLEEPPQSRRSAAVEFLVYGGRARGLRLLPVLVDPRGSSPDPDAEGAERRFAASCTALAAK